MLTRRQVADVLGVDVQAVDRLVKRGRLDVIRLGERTVRFTSTDVMALIETSRERPA